MRHDVETYSSWGPCTFYFGPVTGAVAAPALGSPQVITKPDLVASDCTFTTFFFGGTGPTYSFCGISASSPHAACRCSVAQEPEAFAYAAANQRCADLNCSTDGWWPNQEGSDSWMRWRPRPQSSTRQLWLRPRPQLR